MIWLRVDTLNFLNNLFLVTDPVTEETTIHFRRLVSSKSKMLLSMLFNEDTQIFLSDFHDLDKENGTMYKIMKDAYSAVKEGDENQPKCITVKIMNNNEFDILGLVEALVASTNRF